MCLQQFESCINRVLEKDRVAKCHGYDGYIRVKIRGGWGKLFGRTHKFVNALFATFVRFVSQLAQVDICSLKEPQQIFFAIYASRMGEICIDILLRIKELTFRNFGEGIFKV